MAPTGNRNEGGDIAYGAEPDPGALKWAQAAGELTPEKSLLRIGANARATVTTVTLVATLLGGLGLISSQTLLLATPARVLALTATAMAFLSVVGGLLYLGLRLEAINPADIDEIHRWYDRRFRRAYLAVAASWLLLSAVILAGSAVVTSVVLAGSVEPELRLSRSGTGDARTLDAEVRVSGIDPGDDVTVRVIGEPAGECPGVVLVESRARVADGTRSSSEYTVKPLPCNEAFRLEVIVDGVKRGTLSLP